MRMTRFNNKQQALILAHKQTNTFIIVLDEYFIFKVLLKQSTLKRKQDNTVSFI